jgi:hypothetical protein
MHSVQVGTSTIGSREEVLSADPQTAHGPWVIWIHQRIGSHSHVVATLASRAGSITSKSKPNSARLQAYNVDDRKPAQTLLLEPGTQIVEDRELGMEHVTRA